MSENSLRSVLAELRDKWRTDYPLSSDMDHSYAIHANAVWNCANELDHTLEVAATQEPQGERMHHIWCKSLLKMDLPCNCGFPFVEAGASAASGREMASGGILLQKHTCECVEPYEGARLAGTPRCCERCGGLIREAGAPAASGRDLKRNEEVWIRAKVMTVQDDSVAVAPYCIENMQGSIRVTLSDVSKAAAPRTELPTCHMMITPETSCELPKGHTGNCAPAASGREDLYERICDFCGASYRGKDHECVEQPTIALPSTDSTTMNYLAAAPRPELAPDVRPGIVAAINYCLSWYRNRHEPGFLNVALELQLRLKDGTKVFEEAYARAEREAPPDLAVKLEDLPIIWRQRVTEWQADRRTPEQGGWPTVCKAQVLICVSELMKALAQLKVQR